MNRMMKRLGYGLVAWAVPYVTSLPLLLLMQRDPAVFKTIMIVEGSIVGAILTVAYFRSVTRDYLREGVLLGTVWIVENWLLDFAGILPFNHMTVSRYFLEIGFEYFAILSTTTAIGYVLARRALASSA